jgi:hypothetical protein
VWDDGTPWTLPGVEGKKAEKGKKFPTHFTKIKEWDDDLPWTLPGVEGKKADRTREKISVSFYGNFTVVWDDDPPWTLPAVEGEKAEEKREKISDSFYGNFSVGRRPSMDTAWGRR